MQLFSFIFSFKSKFFDKLSQSYGQKFGGSENGFYGKTMHSYGSKKMSTKQNFKFLFLMSMRSKQIVVMDFKIELVFDARLFTFCLSFHFQSIYQYRSFLFIIMSSHLFSPDEKKWLSFNFIKNGSNFVRNNWSEYF